MPVVPRGLIGVVHLRAMPGDPGSVESFREVERFARADAEALARGGADAIIVENFGSAPFPKGCEGERTAAHQVAFMALVARWCKETLTLPIGVNCLRNDIISALGIAAAADLDFVRVNVHSGAYLTDQGVIEGEAHRSLRYRDAIAAQGVAILADVHVKHAVVLAPMSATEAARDTVERGLADAVIVTGRGTGLPVDRALLEEVRAAVPHRPLLLGSGVNLANMAELAPFADGAIIGSSLKRNGELAAPVDLDRVRAMAQALRQVLR